MWKRTKNYSPRGSGEIRNVLWKNGNVLPDISIVHFWSSLILRFFYLLINFMKSTTTCETHVEKPHNTCFFFFFLFLKILHVYLYIYTNKRCSTAQVSMIQRNARSIIPSWPGVWSPLCCWCGPACSLVCGRGSDTAQWTETSEGINYRQIWNSFSEEESWQ